MKKAVDLAAGMTDRDDRSRTLMSFMKCFVRLLSFLLAVELGLTGCSSLFTWRATLGGSESLSPTPPSDSALVGTWEVTHAVLR